MGDKGKRRQNVASLLLNKLRRVAVEPAPLMEELILFL